MVGFTLRLPRPEAQLGQPLSASVMAALREVMARRGGLGRIRQLSLPHLVADHAEKYIVSDSRGSPSAVVAVAPASDPDSLARAFARASLARQSLDDRLGRCVLLPWRVSDAGEPGFSVMPYCETLGRFRLSLGAGLQALAWLEDVTRHTARRLSEDEAEQHCALPLRRLLGHTALRAQDRLGIRMALADLAAGNWQPRHVLAHNDFWTGNLMRAPADVRSGWPFVVIDWGGSEVAGHPAYDLVRLTSSLGLDRAELGRRLVAHSRILECTPRQMRHGLLCAFGHLAGHLGEWPLESFTQTLRDCLDSVDEALHKVAADRR